MATRLPGKGQWRTHEAGMQMIETSAIVPTSSRWPGAVEADPARARRTAAWRTR